MRLDKLASLLGATPQTSKPSTGSKSIGSRNSQATQVSQAGQPTYVPTKTAILNILKTLKSQDRPVWEHSLRVGIYASRTARELGYRGAHLQTFQLGGRLHDIGKLDICPDVLHANRRLTANEYQQIQTHPTVGYQKLRPLACPQIILDMVLFHHESFDGSGYPHGLRQTAIPLAARITHAADAFDAMTHDRSYRRALTAKNALAQIKRHAGYQFDPLVVEALEMALATLPNPLL